MRQRAKTALLNIILVILRRKPIRAIVERALIGILTNWAQYKDNSLTVTRVSTIKQWLEGIEK